MTKDKTTIIREALLKWADTFAQLKDLCKVLPAEVDDFDDAVTDALASLSEAGPSDEPTEEQMHYLFMGWLHVNHADLHQGDDQVDLLRRAFIDALKYARAQFPSPVPTSEPVLSRDYEALYELLCKGGEALGKSCNDGVSRAKFLRAPMHYSMPSGREASDFGDIDVWTKNEREEFLAACTRLQLEWVASDQPNLKPANTVVVGLNDIEIEELAAQDYPYKTEDWKEDINAYRAIYAAGMRTFRDHLKTVSVDQLAPAQPKAVPAEVVEAGNAILDQLGLFTNEYGDGQDVRYANILKDNWDAALSHKEVDGGEKA